MHLREPLSVVIIIAQEEEKVEPWGLKNCVRAWSNLGRPAAAVAGCFDWKIKQLCISKLEKKIMILGQQLKFYFFNGKQLLHMIPLNSPSSCCRSMYSSFFFIYGFRSFAEVKKTHLRAIIIEFASVSYGNTSTLRRPFLWAEKQY